MADGFVDLVRAFRAAVIAFHPEAYSGEACAVLVEELASAEKASVAARVRAAARAGACGAHRERGFADFSDWLGRVSGSSSSSAKAALETATPLEQQPEVKAALDAGELSLAQAREIVRTEAACPSSAAGLLGAAREQSLKTLKGQARDLRMRAIDPEELHRLQEEAQSWRHWRTSLGTVAFAGELPPEIGIPFVNRLDAETDRLWKQVRQRVNQAASGTEADEPSGSPRARRTALAAQAFVRLVETGGKGKARQAGPGGERRPHSTSQHGSAVLGPPPDQDRCRPKSRAPPREAPARPRPGS